MVEALRREVCLSFQHGKSAAEIPKSGQILAHFMNHSPWSGKGPVAVVVVVPELRQNLSPAFHQIIEVTVQAAGGIIPGAAVIIDPNHVADKAGMVRMRLSAPGQFHLKGIN